MGGMGAGMPPPPGQDMGFIGQPPVGDPNSMPPPVKFDNATKTGEEEKKQDGSTSADL